MNGITKDTNFHFIAIGGVGMSGLAKYLLEEGFSVSGSDISESKYFNQVKEMGANVFLGHNEANLTANSVVIASTAIKGTNPELIKAKKLNMKILHRSDLLKFIAENFQSQKGKFIGFSGTHGKTTTSGLASFVLQKANLHPSFVVGGIIPDINTNAYSQRGNLFVAELDESDGTILKYSPDITVINNIEVDHIDFYADGINSLLKTFTTFISNLKPTAKILINNDCDGNQKLMTLNTNYNFVTYGLNNANYTAKNIKFDGKLTSFDLYNKNDFLTQITLSIHGTHNVYNALAVAVALIEADINIKDVAKYFEQFTGMGRRYQLVSQTNEVTIIDDYAHHPSEISATLECAKKCNKDKRIVAIFQPHRYTRLHGLFNDFLNCFTNADKVLVLDTYAASERPINGHTSEEFAKTLNEKEQQKSIKYIKGKINEITEEIYSEIQENDIVITLGAGDITKLGYNLAAKLRG